MLWLKGWLETRFRFLFILGVTSSIAVLMHSNDLAATLNMIPFVIIMTCAFLAGAGIATQPSLQASKGLHGSTLFTLSLPVSRLRMLAVRSGIGWLEVAAVLGVFSCEMWLILPWLRGSVTPIVMVEEAATLIVCGSIVYFVSVLLGTVLDDQWRTWGTFLSSFALIALSIRFSLPPFANVLQGIGKRSPLVAHTMPWSVMAFSGVVSSVLFFTAMKVAQRREY